jgi:hypothetical protein
MWKLFALAFPMRVKRKNKSKVSESNFLRRGLYLEPELKYKRFFIASTFDDFLEIMYPDTPTIL